MILLTYRVWPGGNQDDHAWKELGAAPCAERLFRCAERSAVERAFGTAVASR